MTFLPIVDRELRVAARKRSTFWLRVIAALVALVIGSGFLVFSLVVGLVGIGPVTLGKGLFSMLTWLSLVVALCSGVFFTSDCLSEEKREGTLGFLFLTNLRGYDVVLGKLLSSSLRGCFALLAIFPVLAVTLLMGGVAAPQFWKTMLALLNALFVSLAVGIFISSLSRDGQRAMMMTVSLLLLVVVGGPIVDAVVARDDPRGFRAVLSLLSPGYVFTTAKRWGPTEFWTALLGCQIVAWSLLVAACWLATRTWQEKATRSKTAAWTHWWKYGGAKRRAKLRQKFMGRSPVLWLACRERWQCVVVWVAAILTLLAFITLLLLELPSQLWMVWGYVGGPLTLLLELGIASQAGRFFVEARRTGMIELLLSAPLPVSEIAQGQWRALLRMFALPVALFLCVCLVATALSHHAMGSVMSSVGGTTPRLVLTVATAVISTIVTAANLVAITWFGMLMGLTSKNTNFATLKTLVFVQVIPWFVISFASGILVWLLLMKAMIPTFTKGAASNPSSVMVWYPFLSVTLSGVLSLAKDVFFVVWARRRLVFNFRELALRAVLPIRIVSPPVAAPPTLSPSAGGVE